MLRMTDKTTNEDPEVPRLPRSLLARRLQVEWLDVLDPTDPRAQRSRRDLRRVNAWMGNARLVAGVLAGDGAPARPVRVVELGAGDGTFLLRVARRLSNHWREVEVVLVDRVALVTPETRDAFRQHGWRVRTVRADVFEWFGDGGERADVVLANLFLHHFTRAQLRLLLSRTARQTRSFLACEPERSRLALAGAHLLGTLGCSRITRHDAVLSVRAGFRGRELAEAWPVEPVWRVSEHHRGFFSHVFRAERATTGGPGDG